MRLYIRRKKPIFPSIHVYVILVLFCENQFGLYVVLGSIEWIKYFRNPPIDLWLCMRGSFLPSGREGRASGPSLENSNLAKITENMLRNSPHTHTTLEKCSFIYFTFSFKFYNQSSFFYYSIFFLSTLKNLIIYTKLYNYEFWQIMILIFNIWYLFLRTKWIDQNCLFR